jgi:hypothetical protein
MKGWLRLTSDDVEGDEELAEWVEKGASFARTLPSKG